MATAPKPPVDPRPVSNGSTSALIVRTQQDFEAYFKAQVQKIVGLSPEKTNIVAPVLQIRDRELLIEAGFVPELTLVNVKWDEEKDDDGKVKGVRSDDIYPVGGGKYALLLPVLEKIARAAGLTWDPDRSRLEHTRESDVYHAYGWLEMMPGHRVPCEATKAIDEETDLEEVTLNAIEKHKKWPKYNPAEGTPEFNLVVRKEMLQRRKFRSRIAESKAKAAAMRHGLDIRSSYRLEELRNKPFAVPRLVYRPDYNDPAVKQMMTARSLGLTRELYGHPASRSPQLPPDGADDVVDSAGMVHAPRPRLVEPDQESPQDPGPPSDQQPEPAAAAPDPTPPAAVSTAIASPPAGVVAATTSVAAAPVNLSPASEQIIAKVRKAGDDAAKRMKGEITVPQLELLQKYLKGNERLVTAFFPDVDEIGDLTRSEASAIADWLLNSTKDERHAFADDVKGQRQSELPIA